MLWVHAHPNDPNGTYLVNITRNLEEQTRIIKNNMLEYIEGIECWHFTHDAETVAYYVEFAGKHGLVMTGGSDCHQKSLIFATVDIPDSVAEQFRL